MVIIGVWTVFLKNCFLRNFNLFLKYLAWFLQNFRFFTPHFLRNSSKFFISKIAVFSKNAFFGNFSA